MMLLNKRADPPIRLEVTKSRTPAKTNVIKYVDPVDGEPFDAGTLSALERGHFYVWHRRGGRYHVETPFRAGDKETCAALRGLRTLLAEKPWCIDECPSSLRNRPEAILRHFSVDSTEWDAFTNRAERADWLTEPRSAQTGALIEDIRSISAHAADLCTARRAWEDAVISGTYDFLADGALTHAVRDLDGLREEAKQLYVDSADVLTQYQTLLDESLDPEQAAEVARSAEAMNHALDALRSTDWERLKRQVLHMHAAATEGREVDYKALHRPLSEELERLTKAFPALAVLSADGDTLLVRLGGCTAVVPPNGSVKLSGPLDSLFALADRDEGGEGRMSRAARAFKAKENN